MKKSIILIICLLSFLISAQSLPYKVSYLTADNGLSRNLVDYIFRDSRGFIWLCTSKGLDRYDGYEFIHFNSRNPINPLKSDNVHCVQEDVDGNLWIGTENGLYFLNYKTGEIVNSAKKLNSTQNYTTHTITFINKDEQGNLWVGYNSGLARIHFNEGEPTAEEVYRSNSAISSILLFNGNILVGSDNEVFRLIKNNNGSYQRVNTDSKLRQFPGTVNALFYDNGQVWIGTSVGLYKYEPSAEALTRYVTTFTKPNELTSSYVTDIAKNKDGQLLIGTLIGLNIYDYHSDSFTGITSETITEGGSLSNNFINCLLVVDNMIWIGTDKGGVNLLSPNQSTFGHIENIPGNPSSLSKNPVNAIYEDTDGDLFVGTVEGGLNVRKKGSTAFLHSYSQGGNNRSLSHNSVSCICQDFNGDYWIGTWGLGINKLKYKDKFKPVFEQFINKKPANSIQSNFIAALAPDNKNKGLWIGTREGLDFLNITSGKFYPILKNLPADKQIHFITGMYIDSKRRMWVGTNYGLVCIYLNETNVEKNKIKYQFFQYLLTNPSSLITEKINCITETKDHRLWFGSNGNGIYTLDEKTQKFNNFDERNGLLDNVVYGMLEDETGTLWISTDKGLCAYNYNRNSIRSFTKSDGLKSNQFYWDAFCKGHDGKMYFGSVAGITVFDPLKASPGNVKNTPTITRIRILNDDVYPARIKIPSDFLQFEGSELTGIRLHESDKAFSVEFSALNYFQSEKIKYAYRLKGFDNNWTEVSSDRRFANFTQHYQRPLRVGSKMHQPRRNMV